MSLHINRFIDKLKAADGRGQKDFVMSMADAKNLHADITKLLLALQAIHEQQTASPSQSTTTEVEIQAPGF